MAKKDKIFSLSNLQLTQLRLTQSQVDLLTLQPQQTGVDLSENKLKELNISFFLHFPRQLEYITKLDLNRNEIEYIPSDLDKLLFLIELNLYSNNIKSLVPCVANLRNLRWLNVNRNPINSESPNFRRLAGPMLTHEDCQDAALAVVEWMKETVEIQKKIVEYDDKNKDWRLKRKMRNLACSMNKPHAPVLDLNESKFKILRPPGSNSDLIHFKQPLTINRERGFQMKLMLFFLGISLSSLVIPTSHFEENLRAYLFFMPDFLTNFITKSHGGVQSFILYWVPRLDTQIFLRVVTECLVKLISFVTGTTFELIKSLV